MFFQYIDFERKIPSQWNTYHTPPDLLARSNIVTFSPAALRCAPAATPETPAPITATCLRGRAICGYFEKNVFQQTARIMIQRWSDCLTFSAFYLYLDYSKRFLVVPLAISPYLSNHVPHQVTLLRRECMKTCSGSVIIGGVYAFWRGEMHNLA